jgi:hypothetical protein
MQVDTFFKHYGIQENPFAAEEARDDPVFFRLIDQGVGHPDFDKIFGDPTQPRPGVVFGEKGSGKTGLRLMIERRLERHNADRDEGRVWIVRYDDLNPILDRFSHAQKHSMPADKLLERFRLVDHQDAMLSLATTRLIDALIEDEPKGGGDPLSAKTARHMPRQRRVDLAELALLYDQPVSGNFPERWSKLRRTLRLGLVPWAKLASWTGVLAALAAAGMAIALRVMDESSTRMLLATGLVAAAAVLLLGAGGWRAMKVWALGRRIRREVQVVDRPANQLRRALTEMPLRDLNEQPVPIAGDQDARYQLTQRLIAVLRRFGYDNVTVLVDRVDEPALVNGEPERMRSLVWPMLNNKFLQQDGVAIKLLLPIELRHLLHKEDADFFQRARLDKQHLVDRLTWSGTFLYDLCTRRLQACQGEESEPVSLRDLFAEAVNSRELIDALDQMHQPRDAFKFLHAVIQEHCANVPEDEAEYKIPRLTLEAVRKQQSQRVQEFHRGLTPA